MNTRCDYISCAPWKATSRYYGSDTMPECPPCNLTSLPEAARYDDAPDHFKEAIAIREQALREA